MDGDEKQCVGGSRKRKKSSLGKDRGKKQSVASTDTPGPSALPVTEKHDVGSSLAKPSLTVGTEANVSSEAGAGAEPSKASSSRRSARSGKRGKKGSKTSSSSSSSSASSQRSRKETTGDCSKTTAPRPSGSKQSHDPARHKNLHEEVAADGRSEKKTTEAVSVAGTAGFSSSSQERQTSSATGASSSPLAQVASTATSGVFQKPGEPNNAQLAKTGSGATTDSSPTDIEKQGSPSARSADALPATDKPTHEAEQERKHTGKAIGASTSCDDQPDSSRTSPAGVSAVADHQAHFPAEVPLDNEAINGTAVVPVNSEHRRASASATPNSNDDAAVAKQGQVGAQTKHREDILKEEQLIEPNDPPRAPQPPPPPSGEFGVSGRRKEQERRFQEHGRADDSKLFSGAGSDAHGEGAHRRTGLSSPINWSFYPLNVTFVTEMDSYEKRLLFGAVVTVIAVLFSLLFAGLILLLYANRVTSPLACVTAECMEARDYLERLLNTSKDACSDFYGYVCDSWLARGPDGGSFHGDSVTASLARINESLWSQEVQEDESVDTRLLRRVYHECHRYASVRPITPFKGTLQSARKQLNWAKMVGCRDYRELVTLLVQTSLLIGLHTVMVLEILSEDGRAVLRLSRGRSLHRKLISTDDRRGNLEAILRSVMNDDAKGLPKILEIDALAERELDVGVSTGTELSEETHGLLEEFLDGLFPSVKATDWIAAINDVLMPLDMYTMRRSDLALASGVDIIRKVFKNITTHGAIDDVALYLASHLDAEVLSLELSRRQTSSDRVKTTRFCLELLQRSHAFLWPELASMLLKPRGSAEVLKVMYSQLQDASKGTVMFTWPSKAMRPYAEEKMMKAELSVISEAMSPKAPWRDEEDSDSALLHIINESDMNFVELYLRVLSVAHENRLRSPPTIARFAISQLERHSELAYSRTTQAVVVPTVYQRSPYLYATGVPSYFNYATVGALLASSVADVVGPAVLSPAGTEHRQISDVWWTPEAMSQYNGTAMCLQRLLGRLGLQRHMSGSGELQRRDLFLRTQGLRMAYDGLVASFGTAVATHGFRQLWVEAQAAFFARFCLLSCDADQTPRPLSPRAKCLVPLHNMPEFGAVFDCVTREDFFSHQCLP